jgi:hypothetical protein
MSSSSARRLRSPAGKRLPDRPSPNVAASLPIPAVSSSTLELRSQCVEKPSDSRGRRRDRGRAGLPGVQSSASVSRAAERRTDPRRFRGVSQHTQSAAAYEKLLLMNADGANARLVRRTSRPASSLPNGRGVSVLPDGPGETTARRPEMDEFSMLSHFSALPIGRQAPASGDLAPFATSACKNRSVRVYERRIERAQNR